MRRRHDQLLPLEEDLLVIAVALKEMSAGTSGAKDGWFHAYPVAKLLSEEHGNSLLSNGTLYRSLRGMAERGLLERRVESDAEALTHAGPPRRYYRLTPKGAAALHAAQRRVKLTKTAIRSLIALPASPGP
jgi:DNA-binding PadR family transcriptional regulator